jgi:hypothetical protein
MERATRGAAACRRTEQGLDRAGGPVAIRCMLFFDAAGLKRQLRRENSRVYRRNSFRTNTTSRGGWSRGAAALAIQSFRLRERGRNGSIGELVAPYLQLANGSSSRCSQIGFFRIFGAGCGIHGRRE